MAMSKSALARAGYSKADSETIRRQAGQRGAARPPLGRKAQKLAAAKKAAGSGKGGGG